MFFFTSVNPRRYIYENVIERLDLMKNTSGKSCPRVYKVNNQEKIPHFHNFHRFFVMIGPGTGSTITQVADPKIRTRIEPHRENSVPGPTNSNKL